MYILVDCDLWGVITQASVFAWGRNESIGHFHIHTLSENEHSIVDESFVIHKYTFLKNKNTI